MKKTIFILAALLIILTFASMTVLAQSGPAKGGKPTATPPPDTPPIPTEIPDEGTLYGDLYVILRDVNGVPIRDENGCIQPISSTDGNTTLPDGAEVTAYAYEPFTLGTYYDSEGVLIECELTEDMTAWVQAVDFGRLNLGRAPEGVIAHAFDEAVNKLNAAVA